MTSESEETPRRVQKSGSPTLDWWILQLVNTSQEYAKTDTDESEILSNVFLAVASTMSENAQAIIEGIRKEYDKEREGLTE